ncbi:hypothetical protein L210DRAFT_3652070 [Boletus edulis BED1]|uniref:Peptidase S30 domain-containing protein n=1 Tax=Boletus edulis BED1 TaxID=1328754 RepID=A0AAD4BGV9_BOLED|nr:hypothetical protein L210DRAFT_3652070 [Boletus edulis BED1]
MASHIISSSTSSSDLLTVSALKRRIDALEEENGQLLNKIIKKPTPTLLREGRAVRRLVCLAGPVVDFISEHDRRQILTAQVNDMGTGASANPPPSSSIEQERAYRSYEKLVLWCPTLARLLSATPDTVDLAAACQQLQEGADGARGDDAATLKVSAMQWLNEHQPVPNPPLNIRQKEGRGFYHDLTGQLLCPVDYDWADLRVRAAVRAFEPDFRVTAHSWPSFLYPEGKYDKNHPAKGLFRGGHLLQIPSNIRHSDAYSPLQVRQLLKTIARISFKVRRRPTKLLNRTRGNVASLLKMKTVQPRAIAYIAAQLRHALSSTSSWCLIDEDFDYEAFYFNIVDYFENPGSTQKTAEINDLLLWWNRKIFGRENVAHYRPQQVEGLSVARSKMLAPILST